MPRFNRLEETSQPEEGFEPIEAAPAAPAEEPPAPTVEEPPVEPKLPFAVTVENPSDYEWFMQYTGYHAEVSIPEGGRPFLKGDEPRKMPYAVARIYSNKKDWKVTHSQKAGAAPKEGGK